MVRAILLALAGVVTGLMLCGDEPRATATPSLAARAGALADVISQDWSRSLAASGAIIDPRAGRPEGSYGGTMLAYGMLRAATRHASPATAAIAERALLTSARASSPFNLLGVSEALIAGGGSLDPAAITVLRRDIAGYGPYDGAEPGTPCFRRIGCYGNHKLVGATAALAALRALAAFPPGTDPAGSARARGAANAARRLVAETVPAVEVRSGPLRVGQTSLSGGAVLSDPGADPIAYIGLSAMMLGRAIELAPQTRAAALPAFRGAVIALLGLAAPDGDIAYMGRGQGQTWVSATTLAACALAERLLSGEARLRAWCAGVIEAELAALLTRRALVNFGVATLPRAQAHAGVDRYYNFEDGNGLCVYALNVGADALAQARPVTARLPPSALGGESFSDGGATGLATTSHGGVWFAVHRRTANLADSRWGFGLVALEVRSAGGWRSLTPRPLAATAQGPLLRWRGHVLQPFGREITVPRPGRIVVRGGWRSDGRTIGATFVFATDARGVTLSLPAVAGGTLLLREWVTPGSPPQVSASAPPGAVTQLQRVTLAAGNAQSDVVEQLTHRLRAGRRGFVRFTWRP